MLAIILFHLPLNFLPTWYSQKFWTTSFVTDGLSHRTRQWSGSLFCCSTTAILENDEVYKIFSKYFIMHSGDCVRWQKDLYSKLMELWKKRLKKMCFSAFILENKYCKTFCWSESKDFRLQDNRMEQYKYSLVKSAVIWFLWMSKIS